MRTTCEQLKEEFTVETLGLYGGDSGAIGQSDIILLPVPTTKDGETVFSPFCGRGITLEEISEKAGERLILTCNYMFKGKNCIDYGQLDSYSLLNAVPTAEGAVKLAIENTDFTLFESRVLVTGYGRCGRVLAGTLKALGADVTVSARKEADFAAARIQGFNTVNSLQLNEIPLDYDIIFNTVDAPIIGDKALHSCTAKLMLDLSSKGGFDTEAAIRHGIKALKAPGLPGKTAPVTAGKILAKTVTDIIKLHI